MSLSAGRLRHRVVIQRQQETQGSVDGSISVSWQDVVSLWAAIEPVSGRELIAADTELSKIQCRIVIRYRADVTAKMRVVHAAKNMYYNIEAALCDKDSGLEYLTLHCSEGVRY